MAKSPEQAIAMARETHKFPKDQCLVFVRTMYGVGAHFHSAADAWRGAQHKHPVVSGAQCPRGAPVFWTGGSHQCGHIAIATGNGNCWSSDAGGPGLVAKVNIDDLSRRWSTLEFQGWTEDVNGVRVFDADSVGPGKAHEDPGQTVSLRALHPVDVPDVRDLQRALKSHMPKRTQGLVVDGCFGPDTKAAYQLWQRRCGFSGPDADGVPGRVSLERLGFLVSP